MADKPRAEKLPLAVRKNVRDGFEAKKEEHIAKLKKILGTDWTFDIDPLAIYPYAPEGSYGNTSLGDCINAYIEGFIYKLEYFIQYHGQEGVAELNSVCSAHTITMAASTKCGSYCGIAIEDGKLAILFHPDNLGCNVNDAADKLDEKLNAAPQPAAAPALPYLARHSIKTNYTAQIGEYLEKARKSLANPEFKFEPDFEALGAKLAASKDAPENWQNNLGNFAVEYFSSLAAYLAYEKFDSDDMLQEGLAEIVTKGVARLRIVDKLKTDQNGYSEVVAEDGELFIETTPNYFGTNIYNTCAKIVDIL